MKINNFFALFLFITQISIYANPILPISLVKKIIYTYPPHNQQMAQPHLNRPLLPDDSWSLGRNINKLFILGGTLGSVGGGMYSARCLAEECIRQSCGAYVATSLALGVLAITAGVIEYRHGSFT